jgi:hypothetical protein
MLNGRQDPKYLVLRHLGGKRTAPDEQGIETAS